MLPCLPLLAGLSGLAGLALPQDAPPWVFAFERFHRPVLGDPGMHLGGMLLLGELGCTACHAAGPAAHLIDRKQAPRLAQAGLRVDATWLRAYLAHPARHSPGTTMPDVLGHLGAEERALVVEDLVHFVASAAPSSSPPFAREAVDFGAAERGEEVYHQIGCVACHGPRAEGAVIDDPALEPLGPLETKYSASSLASFLADPLSIRPSGRMPSLGLSARRARDLAHYLLQDIRVGGPLWFEVRLGRFERFEDVPLAAPVRTGVTDVVDVSLAGRRNDFALVFEGYLDVATAGEHSFHLQTDHRARLSLDGELRMEVSAPADQDQPPAWGAVQLELTPGPHRLHIEAIRRGGRRDPTLALEWTPAGGERGPLPLDRLHHEQQPTPTPPVLQLSPERVARGRGHYEEYGCVNCHGALSAVDSGPLATPLLELRDPQAGCLGEASGPWPRYPLDAGQRSALEVALIILEEWPNTALDAELRVRLTFERLACHACHERDGRGGPTEITAPWFSATTDDPTDEVRLPPPLTGVGDKLRLDWLTEVLATGAAARPAQRARMPRFGEQNLDGLAEDLVSVDRVRTPVFVSGITPEVAREAGRLLVGRDGLGCIACHQFHGQRAEGMQLSDLVTVTERLNHDWFQRFLLDPESLKPGTRMTASWPKGVSVVPDVLGGDALGQVDAIWTYLADGERAVHPTGLSRAGVELVVGGEAVVYRGKLRDAGFRGIAVGFPERIHAAYDAEELRLALLWKGRFLNAGAHWGVQGMGRIGPLGGDVRRMAHGPDLALLSSPDAPWPGGGERTQGQRFLGYDLDRLRRPTFRWRVGPAQITDAPRVVESQGRATFVRTIEVTAEVPVTDLWFRAAQALEVRAVGDHWMVGDDLSIRIRATPGSDPRLREADGVRELLVPVRLEAGSARLVVEYEWGGAR